MGNKYQADFKLGCGRSKDSELYTRNLNIVTLLLDASAIDSVSNDDSPSRNDTSW